MAKKVAIIGAGISGLGSIKNALDAGLEPTAYERDSWIGGIWRFTEDDRSTVQKSTILNTSKHFSCFSDFPIPKDMPNYLPADLYQRYLENYAEKFDLTKRIRFNHRIEKIKKSEDYEDTGRWEVHYVDERAENKEVVAVVYDFVMVCSGVYSQPYIPDIPSIKEFTGEIIHSKKYKTFKGFEGKRVLVVGLGNTAGDIACELSRHAAQVYISTRRGAWILPRLSTGGQPIDMYGFRRSINSIPKKVRSWLFEAKIKSIYNLANFGLEPVDNPGVQFAVINDELPHRIVVGSIIVKDEIDYFKEKQVFFKDGNHIDAIDTVIFATGFNTQCPVLPASMFKPNQSHQFYKAVFSPELSKPTLAVIGCFRVKGPVLPLTELQARWAVQVFNGECILPNKEEMNKDILAFQYHDKMEKYGKASSVKFLINSYIDYMDDVASLIGAKPNLWKMFFQDPGFAIKCFFGPCIPAQYRLVGPHPWSGARKVIEDVEDSIRTPLRTRTVVEHQSSKSAARRFLNWILLALFVLVVGMFLLKVK
ncbi:dimethylaniline monooxygenase [N-oxide-forming] 2-like [Actinia tenebrosa]|uniref:Flavin-containing monooxygenase n=1 Tax=Actinia tenebrosa TaxID=6105 RepID=A0A6P8HCR9_ACTTE|nr:dimethylaniline monooxygenase [N-oxide-forming] 2-like [Actinia tenebrosa]